MKLFNNKNLKHLILPMFILTIVMCIAFTIQTFNQYKKVSIIVKHNICYAFFFGNNLTEELTLCYHVYYN